jgi:Zn-dependent M28 family amino/carboxypeptidase
LLAIAALLGLSTAGAAKGADTNLISHHIRVLSSNEFEGRFPGTIGEAKSVAYVLSQFKKIGLAPGGEVVGGLRTWFQRVPITRSNIVGPLDATLTTSQGRTSWTQGHEIAVRSTLVRTAHVRVNAAPFVFIGSSFADPQKDGHDLDGVDLRGKIALFDFSIPRPGGTSKPGAARPASLATEAARRGAVGALFIHQPALAGYPWATIANSFSQTRFEIPRKGPAPAHLLLEGAIREDAAADLFRASGFDLEAVSKQARVPDFKPLTLKGPTLSLSYDVRHVHGVSRSVIGRLEGTTHPNETIIYGAHWDHEGIGAPDATGDRVYHGALDNASGVAGLLEIARGLAARPRTERSQVFISWTLEEPGLLGSTYYTEHPTYPLATTVAYINLDILLPIGRACDFGGWGYEDSTLGHWLIDAGAAQHRHYEPTSHPERGYKFRSDQYPIASKGVPAIFFMSGTDLLDGGRDIGEAYFTDYFEHHYHQQTDRYHADWKFDGVADDVDLLVDFGRRLGNARTWPDWKPGSEFKPARDLSAKERDQ